MISEYRGDIQILRAVAVSLVLLFHFGVPAAASGYLGVDIFFVISGYLMVKLYGPGATARGFFQRRARRLLPAYFATILATLVAGFLVVLPGEFLQLAQQTVFAATFTSNVGYWMQDSYFAKGYFNPLLHLWSLGVEIQFYLLFPLIMWLCRDRRWLLALAVIGSLGLCLVVLTVSPKTSFFMMPMRFWQFGLGMLAASSAARPSGKAGLAAFAAVLAIPFLPIRPSDADIVTGHPGLAAICVSAATALVLLARLPDGLVSSAGGRLAQKLGDVSYSLYLAHWPILVLLHYAPFAGTSTYDGDVVKSLAGLGLTIAATAVLFRVFERGGARFYNAPRMALAAGCLVALALVLPEPQLKRFDRGVQLIARAAADKSPYRCGKAFRLTNPTEDLCSIGDGARSVMLIGDSHADALKESFSRAAAKGGYATLFSVSNSPLIDPEVGPQWLLDEARARQPAAVYLHFSPDNLANPAVGEAVRLLTDAGIRTVLLGPVPTYRRNVLQMLHERAPEPPLPYPPLERFGGIDVVPLRSVLCDPRCALTTPGGAPLYFDDDHLTLTGARMLEDVIYSHIKSLQGHPDESAQTK